MSSRNRHRRSAARRFVDQEAEFSAGTAPTTAPHLVTIMWRRKLIICACVALCVAAGAVIFSKITPTYSSVAKLHVRQSTRMPVGVSTGQTAQAGPSFSISTEFEIIKSTALLEQALKIPAVQALPTIKSRAKPIEYLQSVLSVVAGRGEDIILISAETGDPHEAALIVNAVADAYTAYNAEQEQSSSATTLKQLQAEKEKRETEYKKINEDLFELRKNNPGMVTTDESKGNLLTQQLDGLSSQLAAAQMATTNIRIICERFEEVKNFPGPLRVFVASQATALGLAGAAADDAQINRQRLGDQLRDLESRYAPNHPEVIRVRGLLASMPMGTNDSEYIDAFRAATQERLATAVKTEATIGKQFDALKEQTLNLNVQEQQYAQLNSERLRAEKLFDLLDTQIKFVQGNGVSGALTVSVLDAASPNLVPVSPQRNKILGLALVAGAALGVSLAMVRDLLDQRLRSLEEIEDTLGTRILGTVPTLGKRVHAMLAGRTVDTRPISDVAEAYRSVRTSLFVARSQPVPARTILVTSAASGEGKSTTVSNLAIATAQMGRRVLLIDADCRMPSLHVVFKVNDGLERGLSSLLTSDATFEESIRPTGIEKLDILTAGPLNSRPAEMLNAKSFQTLLNNLAKRYDHIFIDSPPVLPVTDARVLSAICDMTVLVVRAEKSTRKNSMRARDAIEGVGGKLFGVVVNDAPRRQAQYGVDFDVYPAQLEDDADRRTSRSQAKRRTVHRAVPPLIESTGAAKAADDVNA